MSLYNDAIYNIKQNKCIKDSGKLIAIPFYRMPKFSTYIPGIRRNQYVVVTSNTKQGKTQLTDFLYLNQPVEYIKNNPDCGLDIHIKYYSLEISKEDKLLQAMSYRLFVEFGVIMNPLNLMSVFKGYTIDDNILKMMESKQFKEYFEFFEDKVEIIDHLKSPTGIIIDAEKYARDNGKVIYGEEEWDDGSKHKVIKDYKPNKPDEIYEVIIDHAALFAEKGKTLYECIKTMSSEHLLKLKNKYGAACILVQQQNSESVTQQFTNRGDSILDKVRPTPEGLANCKDVRQDVTMMIGIFSPYMYQQEQYEGWDLTKIRDYHREITVLLNRNGKSNFSIQTMFNGANSFFKELPRTTDIGLKNRVYQTIEKYQQEEFNLNNK